MFQPFEKTGDALRDAPFLATAVKALADSDTIATYANAAALLNWYLDRINWVGFYLWNEKEQALILGPFQGLPACLRISLGKGVCGTAAMNRRTQCVHDVLEFPGHIACDAASRSELVVPLVKNDRLLGVLDIDSPETGRFGNIEAQAMEIVARALTESLDLS